MSFRLALLAACALPLAASAQTTPGLRAASGISRNYAAPLDATGAALWGTPLVSVTRDAGATWQQVSLDSLRIGRSRALSLDADGPVVWAGLYTFVDAGENSLDRLRHAGYAVTTNDGASFRLVAPVWDRTADTVIAYGASRLVARVVTNADADRGYALPYGVEHDPARGRVWVAGRYLGLRTTDDGGATWRRVVLPPDNLDEIRPEGTYGFRVGPKTARFNGHFNHEVLSVLVDSRGTVWAGTLRGLNRSLDGGVSWRRFQPTGAPSSLPSSVVEVLREQYAGDTTRSALWIATRQNADVGDSGRDGLAVTTDDGQTFRQVLSGETVYDLAFDGPTVYAATQRGVLVSTNGGASWSRRRDVCDPAEGAAACIPDRPVFALATTPGTPAVLWAGTAAGLFKSTTGGASWTVERAVAALTTQQGARTTTVETFAYPNPFSPGSDRVVRLRFDGAGAARVRVFDLAMRLVRTLDDDGPGAGPTAAREVLWDGTDRDGLRVPNGPYFYSADVGGTTVRGKILVVD